MSRKLACTALGVFLLALTLAPSPLAAAGPGDGLLGEPAPAWRGDHWLNSPPLALEDLRGRVVLVRWWTAPGCPFCGASAPALNALHERYGGRGLTVVGFYHHKSRGPLDPAAVARHAERFGFRFPLAVDTGWQTLRAWWLDRTDSGWTSVSFLLDKEGVVRWVHPGGQYVEGDDDFAALDGAIRRLLAE